MNQLNKIVALFLLLWIIFPQKNTAQDIRFKQLTINDGLSQNAVFAIAQDTDGYMWFGTKDGLNKYNGYTFTIYQHDPNNKNTLSANYITVLFNDSLGNLWVGTESGVLNRYDKTTDSFQRISLPLTKSMSKNSAEISDITEDRNGNIWASTSSNGFFKLPVLKGEIQENKIKQFYNDALETDALNNNEVRKLYTDSNGMLWIATNIGLRRMQIDTEKFTNFSFEIIRPDKYKNDMGVAVTAIHGKEDGFLWLGTLSGLIKFNTNNFSYETYPNHFSISRYGWGLITEIKEDNKHNLWLANKGELMRFNMQNKTYTSYVNDPFNPESLSYNSVSGLFIDKSNIVWVGTTGLGISYFDPKSHRFSLLKRKEEKNSRITGFSVRSILEENDRYVWISGDVLYRWDRKTGVLKSFEANSNQLDLFGNTGVYSMIKTQDSNLWFATSEGLYVYYTKTGKTRQYKYDENFPEGIPQKKQVYTVYEDHKGFLWIVTENFLSKMIDRNNGIFKHYQYSKIPNYYARPVLFEDSDHKIWLGADNGLLAFDEKKESFYTYQNQPEDSKSLSNNHIKSICPDPEKPERYLWVGTSRGLNLFDKKQRTFTNFTEKEGLPNNVIYGILTDTQNNLWLSTNKGISKFNPKEKTFRNFDIQDGLQSNEFNTGAFFKSKKGEFFFGGILGLTHFFPDQIIDNPYVPSIIISGLKVYNSTNSNNSTVSFTKFPINGTREIIFTPKNDIITFEFAALDFSAPSKNQYAYQLEGLHNDWIYVGNSRVATFTNLPGGKYNFKVKGSNNDGVWNEVGITIPIRILPHWSGTWWAYTSYLLLFLIFIYIIRKYEMKRIELKNNLEIEKKEYNTLKVIDQLKSRFFTNISHEFRTPLTLISGYAENLMESLPSNYAKKQVASIDNNAKNLLKLINELLDISKLEAGKMSLNLSQQNIVLYLKNLFFSLESFTEKRNISLNFISDETDIQVVFDDEKMESVIMNIISNALKFTPENGEITLTIQQKNKGYISICICDNGIGIEQDAIPNIFNRFYQADNSDTRLYEGTGIGLALVKELVELHEGTVKAFRNEELTGQKGTTISIELPIGAVSEIDTGNIIEIEQENGNSLKVNKQKTLQIPDLKFDKKIILLVEDNLAIRAFIKNLLRSTYKIIEANNGEEGLEQAKRVIPDLIITDVMMPKLDGIAMVHMLRDDEKTSHIPIIILSGKATLEDKLIGLETGIEAYLTKPFSVKELQIIINNFIEQREQLRIKYQNKFVVSSEEIPLSCIDQQFLEKTIQHIKDNLENTDFSVEQLADKICLSPSQLNRKLQALIDQAPGQLIRNIRLQRAAELIKLNTGSLADICFQTGFNDQAYFSRAFKNQFGCSPSAYKKDNLSPLF